MQEDTRPLPLPPPQIVKKSRGAIWFRRLGLALGGILVFLLLALGIFWQWSGTEGSLRQVLGWSQRYLPPGALGIEGLEGALRRGGQARHIRWSQGGLTVDVYDARYAWNPRALLRRELHFMELRAGTIQVDDQRPPSEEPSSGPPEALGLPLKVRLDEFSAVKLEILKPQVFSASDVAGSYIFDGSDHRLHLGSARIAEGSYQADVRLGTQGQTDITADLTGNFLTPAPEGSQGVPLSVKAHIEGPLSDMAAQAQVSEETSEQGAPAAKAEAHARITPWASQPLPEAHAEFTDLDVAPFWSAGPHTRLTGRLDVSPVTSNDATGASGWQVVAQIANALPGPWDQQRLPLNQLNTQATWMNGVATVEQLQAEMGGGTLETSGTWSAPASPPESSESAPAPAPTPESAAGRSNNVGHWKLQTQLRGINPGELHTQLAPFPLDGQAEVQGSGTAIDFEVKLQARAQNRLPTSGKATSTAQAQAKALARDLSALRLQSAETKGRWNDGLLSLAQLRVRTADAELNGSRLEIRPAAPSGNGQIQLTVPGGRIQFEGDVQERAGKGSLDAQFADLSRTLAWARKLPGFPSDLNEARIQGQGHLDARWQGGWADPSVEATLSVPELDWLANPSDEAALPLKLRRTSFGLEGKLAQAQAQLEGTVQHGERTLQLSTRLEGGRSRAGASLATSDWRASVEQLELSAFDPALNKGKAIPQAPWRLESRTPVSISWGAASGAPRTRQLLVGDGELLLTAPTRQSPSSASIAWQPVQWRPGNLQTSGRITGLPLAWAELLAGPQLAEAGVSGDVILDGRWDAQLGSTMRLEAEIARNRGDLAVVTMDADTGVQTRIAAGLKDARLQLRSEGQAVDLRLNWDTEQLGTASGELRTQLSSVRQDDGGTGWTWPETALLSGQIQAALPRISAWSTLAPPGWRLRGSLGADVRIAGTRAAPELNGSLQADDLAMRSVVDGIEFSGGRLRARLQGQRLVLDEFSLRGGGPEHAGGSLRATGEASVQDGAVQATMNTTLDRLHASMRTDRLLIASGQLQARVAGSEASVNGRLRVDRAHITLPEESAPRLGSDVVIRSKDTSQTTVASSTRNPPAAASNTQEKPSENGMQLNAEVQIDLGEDFQVQGMGIDTRLAGQLQVTNSGAFEGMPRVTGTINTIGGTFRAYSQQLNVETGTIRFNGPADNPSLDILALRPNYQSDQRVGVQVTGTALLPRVRLYAQPDLPDSEKLAWLILGRAAPSGGAESAMLQQAALAIMGGREGRGVASRFGLDELSFSGGGDTDSGTAGATVTFGKRISDKLYATYEHSLAGAMGAVFIYYELSRRWLLRGQAGERSALDLIYTLSFD